MLELEGVECFYGRIQALKGIDLRVGEGQIVSLLGANGAGKTTTVRTITALRRASRGRIRFKGQSIENWLPHKIVRLGISMVPERREIFPDMSVADNLEMGAYTRRNKKEIQKNLEWVNYLFPVLAERRKQAGGTLSGGEQQMLAIGRALMSRPSLLLLDEPTLGLAPFLVAEIFLVLRMLNEQGLAILLIEQNANQALAISNYAYILENGRIVLEGEADFLRGNPMVQESYLGGL